MLAFALVSPAAGLADRVLTVHMVQHVLLLMVASPLLALGRPLATMMRLLSLGWRLRLLPFRRRARGWLKGRPGLWAVPLAGLAHAAAVAGWHLPVAYDAAVAHAWVHALEHLSFVATGVVLWSVLFEATRRDRYPLVAAVLFALMLESIAIGASLIFASRPVYASYGTGAGAIDDQQLAGVVMWAYGGAAMLLVGLALFVRWLSRQGPSGEVADQWGGGSADGQEGSEGSEGPEPPEPPERTTDAAARAGMGWRSRSASSIVRRIASSLVPSASCRQNL
jgi:cytochrome c oxidase assembly factor CtaG